MMDVHFTRKHCGRKSYQKTTWCLLKHNREGYFLYFVNVLCSYPYTVKKAVNTVKKAVNTVKKAVNTVKKAVNTVKKAVNTVKDNK